MLAVFCLSRRTAAPLPVRRKVRVNLRRGLHNVQERHLDEKSSLLDALKHLSLFANCDRILILKLACKYYVMQKQCIFKVSKTNKRET